MEEALDLSFDRLLIIIIIMAQFALEEQRRRAENGRQIRHSIDIQPGGFNDFAISDGIHSSGAFEKGAYWLRHVRLPLRPSTFICAPPTGRIKKKEINIGDFYKSVWKHQIWLKFDDRIVK